MWKAYRKVSITWAKRMAEPFTCDTLEGQAIKGKAGDYLCKDSKGNYYPCDADIFHEMYVEVDDIK